jgi:signal transduction histidine kinase
MRFSIKYKFTIGLLIIFCFSFNLMTLFMDNIVMENNKKVISDELSSSERDINIYFNQYLIINGIDESNNGIEKNADTIADGLATQLNNRIVLYKNNGKLLLDTEYNNGNLFSDVDNKYVDNFKDLTLSLKGNPAYKIVKINNNYNVIFSEPLYKDNSIVGVLRYSKDYSELFNSGNNLLVKMKIFLLLMFLLIFVFSILLSTKITIPIIKLSKNTKEISNGNFHIAVAIKSKDEIGELGESFNIMKEKIKVQIETIEKDRDALIKLEGHRKVFFDNVTHEMKTPLTIIEGYSQMILDEVNSDEELVIKAASKIKNESNKLHNMIVEILNMSKLESKVETGVLEPLNLATLITHICNDMSIKAKRYEINIALKLEENIYVYANREDVCRMLVNIIDNSIKYGNVNSTIKVALLKENSQGIITIEDKGQGISDEDLQKIFEPFYRSNKNYGTEKSGNGLGLSIAKSIAHKYKGNIDIESVINEGTTVCIKIPMFLQLGNNLIR